MDLPHCNKWEWEGRTDDVVGAQRADSESSNRRLPTFPHDAGLFVANLDATRASDMVLIDAVMTVTGRLVRVRILHVRLMDGNE